MRIGIVSDSHGNTVALRRAIEELLGRGVGAIVHCGDLGGAECLAALADAGVPAYAVAGNLDVSVAAMERRAGELGVVFGRDSVTVELGDAGLLVATHGNRPELLGGLISSGRYAYVCHGHTHRPRDERVEGVRVINPGAIHHARPATAAVLDTQTDTVETISLG